MSYKPLSQTVTDGQKNPISSDAVHDHVAAEIGAIPASASLTLNNLTAPTAVNQDLLLNAGKKIRLNSSTDVYSLLHAQQPDVTSTGITTSVNNSTTVNTGSSVTGILRVNDFIKLSGLATIARITTVNSSTQIVVTPALGDNTLRTIEIVNSSASFRNSSNVETLSIFNNQLRANHGSVTQPTYSFTDESNLGFYRSGTNQISIAGSSTGSSDGRRVTFNLTSTEVSSALVLRHIGLIDFNQVGLVSFRFAGYSDSPSAFLNADGNGIQFSNTVRTSAIGSHTVSFLPSLGLLANTGGNSNNPTRSDGRFATGGFTKKVSIGTLGPYGTYGGLVSARGFETNLSSVSSIVTDNTTTFKMVSPGFTTANPHKYLAMGIGDKIRIQKSGQPDLITKITNTGSNQYDVVGPPILYGVTDITVDQTVSTAYSNGSFVLLPALIELRTNSNNSAFHIDYAGNVIFNENGVDADFQVEGDTDANLVFVDASTDRVGIGTATPAEKLEVNGNIKATSGDVSIATAGKGLKVAEGSNATMGVATLAAGTVTVNTTEVKSNSRIMLTTQVPGGTVGFVHVSARTADTSFVITSSEAADTSEVAWLIINPA